MLNNKYIVVSALSLFFIALTAQANHAWGSYHWFRTANPFTMTLGDNMSSNWDSYLGAAANDWSISSVLDVALVPGKVFAKTCKPVAGRVEACNSKYGNNGWLGIASIWINGDHITQGTVKMNDTYFNSRTYNTPAWRNLVLCQEVGHTLGLDHQDEAFTNANLGTCMDYTNSPESNQHPNQHDYDMLGEIYAHPDGATAASAASAQSGSDIGDDPNHWGKEIKRSEDGRASLYKKDLGGGKHVFTHVFWAEPKR